MNVRVWLKMLVLVSFLVLDNDLAAGPTIFGGLGIHKKYLRALRAQLDPEEFCRPTQLMVVRGIGLSTAERLGSRLDANMCINRLRRIRRGSIYVE